VPARLGKPSNALRVGKLSGLPGAADGLSGCKGITEGDVGLVVATTIVVPP
jgi:hypothetical protein